MIIFYLHLKQLRRNLGVDPFSFCSKKREEKFDSKFQLEEKITDKKTKWVKYLSVHRKMSTSFYFDFSCCKIWEIARARNEQTTTFHSRSLSDAPRVQLSPKCMNLITDEQTERLFLFLFLDCQKKRVRIASSPAGCYVKHMLSEQINFFQLTRREPY